MTQLTSADHLQVLDSIQVLNSGVDPASLGERSLNCVMTLIPNEMTAFDGFDSEGYYDGSLWYSPDGTVSAESVQILGELVHEHPCFEALVSAADMSVTRTSDAMPLKKFHRTALYNEFYRTFEGETQLSAAMRLAPTSLVTCNLLRPTLDFSDREVEMWKLLVPHLKSAFRNAQFVDQIDRQRRCLGHVVAKGLIVIGEDGLVVFESDLARDLLNAYFAGRSAGDLPVEIREFIVAQTSRSGGRQSVLPPRGLTVVGGRGTLRVTTTYDTTAREWHVFLEQKTPHEVGDFKKAGISHREAEILYWVSQGKTDPEIAKILSISPRTVHKHLEHVFTKLGVETRTAAVLQSIDFF